MAQARESRPHLQLKVSQLDNLAHANWENRGVLEAIRHELRCRSTRQAKHLEKALTEQISALKADNGRSSSRDRHRSAVEVIAELENKLRVAQAIAVMAEERAEQIEQLKRTVEEVERRLQHAERAAKDAELRAIRAEQNPIQAEQSGDARLYSEVGLFPGCQDFVFIAVRRAYLKKYHPDSLGPVSEAQKARSANQFKKFHALFEKLEAKRRSREA